MAKGKAEYVEFTLTEDRFLQQVGQREAHYVWASPSSPVKVRLPPKIKKWDREKKEYVEIDQPEGPNLRRFGPLPIVDVRPNVNYSDTAPANVARAVDEDGDEGEQPGLRAADQ